MSQKAFCSVALGCVSPAQCCGALCPIARDCWVSPREAFRCAKNHLEVHRCYFFLGVKQIKTSCLTVQSSGCKVTLVLILFILVVLETFHRWRGGKRANKVMMRLCSFHNGYQILFSKPLASKMIAGLFSTSRSVLRIQRRVNWKAVVGSRVLQCNCCSQGLGCSITQIGIPSLLLVLRVGSDIKTYSSRLSSPAGSTLSLLSPFALPSEPRAPCAV